MKTFRVPQGLCTGSPPCLFICFTASLSLDSISNSPFFGKTSLNFTFHSQNTGFLPFRAILRMRRNYPFCCVCLSSQNGTAITHPCAQAKEMGNIPDSPLSSLTTHVNPSQLLLTLLPKSISNSATQVSSTILAP